MEMIYILRIFLIIVIWLICGYLLGWKPERMRGWRQYAVVLIGGMLIFTIIHW